MDISLPDQFGERISEVSRRWRQMLGRRMQEHGISYPQYLTLITLARMGDGTVQKRLAEAVGVEGSTLVGLIDRLAAAGYVERREAPHDRRYKTLHLTAKARARLAELGHVHTALRHELLDDVTPDDLAAALRVFEHIIGKTEP